MAARLAQGRVLEIGIQVEFINAGVDSVPLDSRSVDTVLMTCTLCTIAL